MHRDVQLIEDMKMEIKLIASLFRPGSMRRREHTVNPTGNWRIVTDAKGITLYLGVTTTKSFPAVKRIMQEVTGWRRLFTKHEVITERYDEYYESPEFFVSEEHLDVRTIQNNTCSA